MTKSLPEPPGELLPSQLPVQVVTLVVYAEPGSRITATLNDRAPRSEIASWGSDWPIAGKMLVRSGDVVRVDVEPRWPNPKLLSGDHEIDRGE